MSEPFLGEIRIFSGNFAPSGWALCNGQLMPIAQATALFSLLGTSYGGDGRTNFALPNLQGSVPMHQGQGPGLSQRQLGETGGEASVTLNMNQMPAHAHVLNSSASPSTGVPSSTVALSSVSGGAFVYRIPVNTTLMAQSVSFVGASGAHNNLQPYLGLTFIIALQGIFPPRS